MRALLLALAALVFLAACDERHPKGMEWGPDHPEPVTIEPRSLKMER